MSDKEIVLTGKLKSGINWELAGESGPQHQADAYDTIREPTPFRFDKTKMERSPFLRPLMNSQIITFLVIASFAVANVEPTLFAKCPDSLHEVQETAKSPSGSLTQKKPEDAYDPLKIPDAPIETIELTVNDQERSRKIPLLVYLPKVNDSDEPAAVIIHSHGLGGTRETSGFLGTHWAARGYAAVFSQHPGSDDSVWKDIPAAQRMRALRQAASGQNLILRVQDVPAVIDQLEIWNADKNHPLFGKLNLQRIGMSGHSFGAITTQYVSGQSVLGKQRYTDTRIVAAISMSPSSPKVGDVKKAFGEVKIPWLCMTGTDDNSVIGNGDVNSRLAVFPALPENNKYELVLDKAEHSVFTERPLPGDARPRNPNHHRAIKGVSTAFWDAYLLKDAAAKTWIDGEKVRTILESGDSWQRK